VARPPAPHPAKLAPPSLILSLLARRGPQSFVRGVGRVAGAAAGVAPASTMAAPSWDGLPTLDPSTLEPLTPVVVSYARTPMGSFLGSLAPLSAPELAAAAIRGALARANGRDGRSPPSSPTSPPLRLDPADVDEVLLGCVCSADLGQAPASQAARLAGLPDTVPATLINKVCASGLKAVALAAQAVACGSARCVVAGGMESMSRVPHYAPGLRVGRLRLGHGEVGGVGGGGQAQAQAQALPGKEGAAAAAPPPPPAPPVSIRLVDGLLRDGLWCAQGDQHMADCAELAAEKFGVSRVQQDDAALATFERARAAEASGAVRREIVPVEVVASSSSSSSPPPTPPTTTIIDRDEPLGRLDEAKLRALKPYFRHDGRGTITAGNASPLTDGAAACVVTSAAFARERGLPVLAAVRGWADANGPAEWFSTAPSKAAPLALARATVAGGGRGGGEEGHASVGLTPDAEKKGLTPADVDFWEVNEAFMVVDLVNRQLLGLEEDEGWAARRLAAAGAEGGASAAASAPLSRVNAHGGAVALGHAIGASGAVLVGRLVNVLRTHGGRVGCAVICNGGGGASALVLEAAAAGGGGGAEAPRG
jgi:acetyl-CoA C-acetyltransferase